MGTRTPSVQLRQLIQDYRDDFENLRRLATLDELATGEFPDDPHEREETERLIFRLSDNASSIERLLQTVIRKGEMNLQEVRDADYEYYCEHIAPNVRRLAGLFLYTLDHDRMWLRPVVGGGARAYADHDDLYEAFRAGLSLLSQQSAEESPDLDLALSGLDYAQELLDSELFQPDMWARNLQEVRPILLNGRLDAFPPAVRQRLIDMYRSFVFGAWSVVIASARANLEYILRDGLGSSRTLGRLIKPAEAKWPALQRIDVRFVQRRGNEMMHPKRAHDGFIEFPIVRNAARNCLTTVVQCAEIVYRG